MRRIDKYQKSTYIFEACLLLPWDGYEEVPKEPLKDREMRDFIELRFGQVIAGRNDSSSTGSTCFAEQAPTRQAIESVRVLWGFHTSRCPIQGGWMCPPGTKILQKKYEGK